MWARASALACGLALEALRFKFDTFCCLIAMFDADSAPGDLGWLAIALALKLLVGDEG
jgi:hypothetical protein